uniref:Copia protein n=1 Tax=Tanacetum cinerariifolium TaxID=118510 RepID=A0A699GLE0_TANCI|nr:copia protein [Tanacetum cinerariifolium]
MLFMMVRILVKRALFTFPVAAKSSKLGDTPVVVKSRFSAATSPKATNKIVDSECSKHMNGNLKLLRNFIEKFMGTVHFGNDNFATITGYGDHVQVNLTICDVYYVEGLGYDLFLVGQFCDGDLEVAFHSNTCYVQNLEGEDLLIGSRDSNLYTITISKMVASSPVCLMSQATLTKLCAYKVKHELIKGRKPNVQYFHLFGSFCYPINDRDNLGKMKPKSNIGPGLNCLNFQDSLEDVNEIPSHKDLDNLFVIIEDHDAPKIVTSLEEPVTQEPITSVFANNFDEQIQEDGTQFDRNTFMNSFGTPEYEEAESSSTIRTRQTCMSSTSNIASLIDRLRIIQLNKFAKLIKDNFEMPMMGDMKFFLGLQACLTEKHLKEVKSIFHYLRHSINMGLWYLKDFGFELISYSDADHTGCHDDCKSTSGGNQFLGDKLVNWSSKKQDCTALSNAKAKYVSLSACCAQVIWMRMQLLDYGYCYTKIPMYCDSKNVIAISCNLVQYSRTKHINIRYHFIKEHVEHGTLKLYFVRMKYQLADLFTKALPKERFEYLVHRIVFIMAQQQVIPTDELVTTKYQIVGRCNNYAMLQNIPCSKECKIVGTLHENRLGSLDQDLTERDSSILWKLILLFSNLKVMVPLSNLITALAVVKNGVPNMKSLFSSSFISRITKSTGYTNPATSTNAYSAIPKGDGVPSHLSNYYLFWSSAGCEFLKKSEHFCHSVVDLFVLFEDRVFEPLHSFGVYCDIISYPSLESGSKFLGLKVWIGIPALMVIEGKVLNDFSRFVGVLIMEFAAGGAVNFVLKMKGDMIIIFFNFKPMIECHDEGLFGSFPVERIEQGNE